MTFTLPLAVRLRDTVVSHRDLNHVDLDKLIIIVYRIIINLPKSTRFGVAHIWATQVGGSELSLRVNMKRMKKSQIT